jgi:PAS domain S-box-containing protein
MALDSPETEPARRRLPEHYVAFAGTALAYAVAGWAGSLFAIGPGYASPLYPAAGIALASVLVYGRRMLPAVVLGSLCADLLTMLHNHHATVATFGLAATFAIGAALQALLGATLVQRALREPLTLAEPADIGLFFSAGMVASCLSASLATIVLGLSGAVPEAALPMTGATWWLGDLLGVLVAAPATLTLIGRPRDAWVPRRLSVGLTLVLVTAFLAAGIGQAVRWNAERTRTAFERDAAGASLALAARLQGPLYALEALRGVLTVSRDPTRAEIQLTTKNWLDAGGLQAMGWSERVQGSDVASYEARNRAEGSTGYRVFDRDDAPAQAEERPAGLPGAPREVMAIRFIEPLSSNASALGVNALSIPAASAAIDAARRTGRPAATAGFRLTQQSVASGQTGVVVYQAIYSGTPATAAERLAATRGVVFVSLAMDAPLRSLAAQFARYLKVCIVDTDANAPRRRLAGPAGCETESAAMLHVRPLAFAGRQWDLRVFARAEDLPPAYNGNAWLFSLIGLFATALLGAFLLTVTGRTRRIEIAVRQRTAALEAEVGEREIAEAALRDSEQRFRNILDNVPIGVIYTNVAGDVIQANPRFYELTGYSEDELLSLSLLDFTHPDDVAQEIDMVAQLVRGDIPMYRRNKRYITKASRTVWVQSTVSLLRDSQNQPWRIVGVVEDITEHLRLEEAEHAREAAEASNRAKSEFLSRMSHELRTPLNAMLGFAQLLELDQRHPLTEAQKPWVVQIQQAGWHLLEMINDVLDLSRIESGNLRLQTETLNLTELLEATVAMVVSEAQTRAIVISQGIGPGTAGVVGDATRVKQILTNLLSNAVKYNCDAGRIHIASRVSAPDSVEIAVTDTGLGMTPRQMAELFQPFNRLGRERGAHQGTGIGLVISQRLAELMGGSLKAKSVAGQGSSFILSLPRAIDPETVRSDLDPLQAVPADYHRRVVHYIEDNETNVEVMRGILAQRPQVQMEVSITGLDGLAAVRARRPDLILLDMHLPDISGLELLRHLKSDPETANIPIVVVSADALAQQITDALEAGAERYLTKPVSVGELLAVLDDLLDRIDTGFS